MAKSILVANSDKCALVVFFKLIFKMLSSVSGIKKPSLEKDGLILTNPTENI